VTARARITPLDVIVFLDGDASDDPSEMCVLLLSSRTPPNSSSGDRA
jgi:hypothetical protein